MILRFDREEAGVCGERLEAVIARVAREIGLTEEETEAAVGAVGKRRATAEQFYRRGLLVKNSFGIKYLENRYVTLAKRYGGAYALGVTCLLAERVKTDYEKNGIPNEVYRDTMSDIRIWAKNYRVKRGAPGLDELEWMKLHFLLKIFRLGRLQFQFLKNTDPAFRRVGVKLREPMIFVHIPQGSPLETEEAKRSFCAANRFFERFFPQYDYRVYLTESWLIYSKNDRFMRENCNILRFAALFEHVKDKPFEKEATSRIFGAEYAIREGETALQRACRAYQKGGGKLGVGVGYIDKNTVKLWETAENTRETETGRGGKT